MQRYRNTQLVGFILIVATLVMSGCDAPNGEQPTPTETPPTGAKPEPGDFAEFPTPPSADKPEVEIAPTEARAEILLPSPTPTETQAVVEFIVTATVNANCRTGPSTIFDQYGFLLMSESTEAIGRLADTTWLRVQLPDRAAPCWIADTLLTYSFDPALLPVVASPPTPTPALGSIGGILWHEICQFTGGEGGAPVTLGQGCVQYGTGPADFGPNQIKDGYEDGWAGVTMHLGAGACPSTGLATTVTSGSGAYSFSGLAAGTYCVSYNPLGDGNDLILIPGSPTYPIRGAGGEKQTVELDPGENAAGVNFGWAWQFYN